MRVDLYVDLYVALCEHFGTFLRASDASTLARFAGIEGEPQLLPGSDLQRYRTPQSAGNSRRPAPLPPVNPPTSPHQVAVEQRLLAPRHVERPRLPPPRPHSIVDSLILSMES